MRNSKQGREKHPWVLNGLRLTRKGKTGIRLEKLFVKGCHRRSGVPTLGSGVGAVGIGNFKNSDADILVRLDLHCAGIDTLFRPSNSKPKSDFYEWWKVWRSMAPTCC
jgi:hypothetical protein